MGKPHSYRKYKKALKNCNRHIWYSRGQKQTWPDESYSPNYGPRKEFDECLRRFFVKIEQEHPVAPSEFKDPYSTCTFIALMDYDELHAGHVYHVARNGDSYKIQFENNEIGRLQASKIVQVIKEG